MLSIARAVINKPDLLIMDEPSLGPAPIIVDEVFRIVRKLHEENHMTIMLVEQNANKALDVSKSLVTLSKKVRLFLKGRRTN